VHEGCQRERGNKASLSQRVAAQGDPAHDALDVDQCIFSCHEKQGHFMFRLSGFVHELDFARMRHDGFKGEVDFPGEAIITQDIRSPLRFAGACFTFQCGLTGKIVFVDTIAEVHALPFRDTRPPTRGAGHRPGSCWGHRLGADGSPNFHDEFCLRLGLPIVEQARAPDFQCATPIRPYSVGGRMGERARRLLVPVDLLPPLVPLLRFNGQRCNWPRVEAA
jgi:hypothetical protein